MSTEVLIGLVVGVVALIILIGVVGYVIKRRRQISITDKPAQMEATDGTTREVDRSGGYQAGSGFSFSQGGAGAATLDKPASEPGPEA